MLDPIRVLITHAADQVAYSLVFMVSNGEVFGQSQPIILHLLDAARSMEVLDGLVMELNDCAFPLLREVVATCDPNVACKDIDASFVIEVVSRKEDVDQKEITRENISGIKFLGEALKTYAKREAKILVLGRCAKKNALLCSHFAFSIPKTNFAAMSRLDQNRAQFQIAKTLGVNTNEVSSVMIWGCRAVPNFPDMSLVKICCDGAVTTNYDHRLDRDHIISEVQNRDAAIVAARKLPPAMSVAKAASEQMRDWWIGTQGRVVSMSVITDAVHYGFPAGDIASLPIVVEGRQWSVADGLPMDSSTRARFNDKPSGVLEELMTSKL